MVTPELRLVVAWVGGINCADCQHSCYSSMSESATLLYAVLKDAATEGEQLEPLVFVSIEISDVDVCRGVIAKSGKNTLVGIVIAVLLPCAALANVVLQVELYGLQAGRTDEQVVVVPGGPELIVPLKYDPGA